jgi:hypothetical protein
LADRKEAAMKSQWIGGMVLAAVAAFGLGTALGPRAITAAEGEKGPTSGPRYSVVETEGHNLLVTDNRTDVLYFYTIDKDAKIGSDLKLRGKIDLSQVGKEVVTPTDVHLRK